ncbi:single-stranded DNA-binding protein [Wolinella succinogenes]|uniref:Single-stranded DNA-binding protein n=1 Tax=Wolinella succinogenes (strain ATCC 29543 / DSM 1740 / CCUG 13145 / JCM 31913 / LMG 7466 / NCTC 11488 / FDC 602W) TaxID=273121 RepID=SSB_WOLSU|nr:single-stranded DNA-binding protein [Wolinella succinogenes]P59933.1 RecName: Full=Single-stranded DNA-binding protein; Short=SSB [Wolinella succinogenes DSM 1740]HCZ18466.1 single-stranded DNA-binding protein [Helicobacter sp.]NLU33788.1 single-stranded DNA-binding protein [Wolinella succinogenes]CAE10882.1 SINGLE-STRAND DNA BINDING PROTEIN [Wolinella succinogenes]VEG81041.1 Helix-destabilizing protein [Wolinella succinogenes]
MYNKVILVGNLTRDVELRYLPSGSALAKIGIATNRRFKKQDGSQGDEVCFVDVNLFGRTAEIANQYLKKGSKILIEGRLVLESWTDQSGQKRSKHSVTAESLQMLDSKGASQGGYEGEDYSSYDSTPSYGATSSAKSAPNTQAPYKEPQIPEINIDDDEIPF